jgi:hypothetical protein
MVTVSQKKRRGGQPAGHNPGMRWGRSEEVVSKLLVWGAVAFVLARWLLE